MGADDVLGQFCSLTPYSQHIDANCCPFSRHKPRGMSTVRWTLLSSYGQAVSAHTLLPLCTGVLGWYCHTSGLVSHHQAEF